MTTTARGLHAPLGAEEIKGAAAGADTDVALLAKDVEARMVSLDTSATRPAQGVARRLHVGPNGVASIDTGSSWFTIGADTGDVKATARPTAPSGWLVCDGSAVSRLAQPALFAAIGTTYGAGDGSNTFNVPDLRGRVPTGRDPSDSFLMGATALGAKIGAAFVQLYENHMPRHHHVSSLAGGATYVPTSYAQTQDSFLPAGADQAYKAPSVNGASNNFLYAGSVNDTSDVGNNQGHPNVQPSLVVNYLIKT